MIRLLQGRIVLEHALLRVGIRGCPVAPPYLGRAHFLERGEGLDGDKIRCYSVPEDPSMRSWRSSSLKTAEFLVPMYSCK